MVTGPTIAHMTAHVAFERACVLADIPRFRREQAAAREHGRYLGFGMCVFAEAAPGPPDYSAALGAGSSSRSAQQARARLERDGTVSVFTSQQPHGQGHETTLAQLAADGLGIPVEPGCGSCTATRATRRSTRWAPEAVASATLASGAVVGAVAALRDRIVDAFAERHELDPQRRRSRRRAWCRPGACRRRRGILPTLASESPDSLEATADFAIPDGGWTDAAHCCWVEVDVATGLVNIPRYLVVEDCGKMINPTIVDGQIAGGVAQGSRPCLLERFVYDDDGQLRTTTLLDYLLPTAAEIADDRDRAPRVTAAGPDRLPRRRGDGGNRRTRGAVERDRRRPRTVRCADHPEAPVRPIGFSSSFMNTQHFVNPPEMTEV